METNKSNNYTLKWNDYHVTMQTEFKRLLTSRDLADLKLICQNQEVFFCHKIVMAMGSEFLERILLRTPQDCCCNNAMTTTTTPTTTTPPATPCCSLTEIILPEVKSRELEKILTFVYEGQVNVGEGDLGDFFEVAKQLGIKGLVEEKKNSESILVKALLGNNNDLLVRNCHVVEGGGGGGVGVGGEMEGEGEDESGGEEDEKSSEEDSKSCEFDEIMNFDEDDSGSFHSSTKTRTKKYPLTTHPEQQPSTSSTSILNNRIRATDPRPCPKCGKIYRSAHTLRTHLEDKHTSCPGYRCVLCGTVAKSRNSLHSHMSRQHRGISTKDLPVLPMPAPFDPNLAARLLGENYGNTGSRDPRNLPPAPTTPGGGEESTGSAILDTYLRFIQENTGLFGGNKID